jgi:quinol monooxygenase YgiN
MTNQIQCTYELKITPGKADEIRQIANDIVAFNEEGEPNTLVYNVYMSPDETHFTFLETWADADAGLFHAERFGEGSFVGEIVARTDGGRLCLYGPVSQEIHDWAAGAGLEFEHWDFIAGFTR